MKHDLSADAAIIFGSGLAVVPAGAEVVKRVPYADLGWPVSTVAGHAGELLLARLGERRLLLACGRSHLYEGCSTAELSAAVDSFAAWGVKRLVLINAAGGLVLEAVAGSVVVADSVVDLQSAPRCEAEVLPVCSEQRAEAVRAAVGGCSATMPATQGALAMPGTSATQAAPAAPGISAMVGRYVAVPGPQYETPAEAAWLASFGAAVGMSTAPEVRAAGKHGLDTILLACVVNRSSAVAVHDEVLVAGAQLTAGLQACLPAVLGAAWPAVFGPAA